jgi:hypothetical protein
LIIEKMEEIDCLRSCESSKLVRLGLGITWLPMQLAEQVRKGALLVLGV